MVILYGQRKTYRAVTAVCVAAAALLLLAMSFTQAHAAVVVLAFVLFACVDCTRGVLEQVQGVHAA